ncbi:MAG: hypothetical protein KAH22_02990 [Thiotrichaceae bacterium]|nr:hypothetical protein [Thiotrichaceae bacterium]
MSKTRHMHKRMNQRGVTQRMVKIVSELGVTKGDKHILGRRNIDDLIQGLDKLRKDLLKLRDKGGLIVVESNDTLITTYRIDSYDRNK